MEKRKYKRKKSNILEQKTGLAPYFWCKTFQFNGKCIRTGKNLGILHSFF